MKKISFEKLMEKYPNAILGLCDYSKPRKNGGIIECSFIAPSKVEDFAKLHAGITELTWDEDEKGFNVEKDHLLYNEYYIPYNIYIPYKLETYELDGDIKDFLDANPDLELVHLPVRDGQLSMEFLELRKIKETGELRVDNNFDNGSFSPVLEYTFSNVSKDYDQGLISTEIEQTRVKFKIPVSVKYTRHKNESYLYTQTYDTSIITGYFYKKITTFD